MHLREMRCISIKDVNDPDNNLSLNQLIHLYEQSELLSTIENHVIEPLRIWDDFNPNIVTKFNAAFVETIIEKSKQTAIDISNEIERMQVSIVKDVCGFSLGDQTYVYYQATNRAFKFQIEEIYWMKKDVFSIWVRGRKIGANNQLLKSVWATPILTWE